MVWMETKTMIKRMICSKILHFSYLSKKKKKIEEKIINKFTIIRIQVFGTSPHTITITRLIAKDDG